jgi:cation/acetate symporter
MSELPRFNAISLKQSAAFGGSVVALCFVGAILSALGLSPALLSALFVLIGLVACAILANKTAPVLPSTSGITFSIEALSAFGLFGIVGTVFAYGHDGLAIVIGLAAGFIVNLMFVGPRYSAIASRSVPDFLSLRFGGDVVRPVALGVMVVVAVLFVAAQFVAAGLIAAQGLDIMPLGGVLIGAIAVLALAVPLQRGTLGLGHLVLAAVALIGGLIAAVWLLSTKTGVLLPHFAYGGLFTDIGAAESRLGLETHFDQPGEGLGLFAALSLVVCLAVGSAVMPHLLARSSIEGSQAKSQEVSRRALVLFVLFATALPALGVLARAEILTLFTTEQNALPFIGMLPAEVLHGALVCQTTMDAMREACLAQGFADGVPVEELRIDPQAVLLALPALVGASDWLRALLSLVGLAVLAVAGASAVHTLACAFASRSDAEDASRICTVVSFGITAVAAIVAITSGLSLIALASWSYSLIAAALIGPLLIGLSWPRTNEYGALAGMIGGFCLTALYILGAHWGFDFTAESGDEWLWLGIPPMMAGIFGIVFAIGLTVIASVLGPKPKPSQVALLSARIERVTEVPEVLE